MYDFLIPHFRLSEPLEYVQYTQMFGENRTSFYQQLGMMGHNGLDYSARIGTHLFAIIEGAVTYVGTDGTGGKSIRYVTDPITHEGKLWRLEVIEYHLSEMFVQAGSRINRFQHIGLTGNTGYYTTGPHLHEGVKPQWSTDGGKTWNKDYNNGYKGAIDHLPFKTYKPMPENNPYNLLEDTLVQLTEGKGGFGLWARGRFYVDETDKILASFMVRNSGVTAGKTASLTQEAWDQYKPKFNLKDEVL